MQRQIITPPSKMNSNFSCLALLRLLLLVLLPSAGKAENASPNFDHANNFIAASIPPVVVNAIQVYTNRYAAVASEVAVDVFRRRLPHLWQKYQIQIEQHLSSSRRNASSKRAGIAAQWAMQVVVKTILDDETRRRRNKTAQFKTFMFGLTFNGPGEASVGGLITPMYNLNTISALSMADDTSNTASFPLSFRICPTNLDVVEAHRRFVRLLGFQSAAIVIVDTASVQSFRRIDNFLRKDQVSIVASHVVAQQSIDAVAKSLLYHQPGVILSTFTTYLGAQAICKLFKLGILAQDFMWMVSGRFDRPDWWEPQANQTGWQCTRQEMISVLNGSFAIDMFVEPPNQPVEEVERRTDRLSNAQVVNLMINKTAGENYATVMKSSTISTLYVYDSVFASLLAFYRAADRLKERYGYSIANLTSYHGEKYRNFSRIYKRELLNTSFYGATGLVGIRNNTQSGQGVIQLSQFQSAFSDNESNFDWVLIGKVDITANTNQTWMERVRYGTATGEAPDVIRRRDAASRRQTTIILSSAAAAISVSLIILVIYFAVRRARRKARHDIAWLVDDARLVHTKVAVHASGSLSHASLVESLSARSVNAGGGSTSSLSQHAGRSLPDMFQVPFSALEDVYTLDGSVRVRLRHLSLRRREAEGFVSASFLSSLNASKLNRDVFPQARSMFNLMHDNVNRFYGIKFTSSVDHNKRKLSQQHERSKSNTQALTFDALMVYQPKGSIRNLLRDSSLQLEHEMKMLFLTDAVDGLIALHDKVGPHGFLHSHNLLLDERYTVKITDYGLQKFMDQRELIPITAQAGELAEAIDEEYIVDELVFRPPEVLRNGYDSDWAILTPKTDVYSLAMVIVEIMTRQPPFADELDSHPDESLIRSTKIVTAAGILEEILNLNAARLSPKRPKFNNSTSKALQELLVSCWHENPSLRPLPLQVLSSVKHLPGYRAGNVMENLVKRLEKYAQNLQSVVDERTQALAEEMKKTEDLLLQILPRSVANELKRGNQVLPETFNSVSIYYSDIVGFTTLSSQSTPMQVVTLLNALYTMFDSVIAKYDVYKVETIGDAYMVASGVPHSNGSQHCVELARLSLKLLGKIRDEFTIPHRQPPEETRLKLRIGLHTGPCVAGVVGLKMPRYCLFGDTVIYANRMESSGLPLKIQASEAFYNITNKFVFGQFLFERRSDRKSSVVAHGRETTAVKEISQPPTYWLIKELSSQT